MAGRRLRHQRIKALISDQAIRNQQELQELLAVGGISVTQATLSRDLRELEVSKSPDGYRLPGDVGRLPSNGEARESRLGSLLRREALGLDAGGGLVVLRTAPGHADALAIEIDRLRAPDVAGTIAGDDTVFVATHSQRQARSLLERLRALANRDRGG